MSFEKFQMVASPCPDRRLVSFFLICYNQAAFIRDALAGAFAQSYQPLEIVISDDCSTDETFDIIKEMVSRYKGPHRLIVNRNEFNQGLCGNVNRLLDLASGEIIVIAGGDDISLPDRVEKSWRLLQEHKDAYCVSFRTHTINADGVPYTKPVTVEGGVEKFTLEDFISRKGFHVNGASRAFRKSAFTSFGPLSKRACTEDSTVMLRCLMLGSVLYSHDLGIYYRVHGDNYYASQRKFTIKYERIYWQYLLDMAVAVKMGILTSTDASRLKLILRKRLRANRLKVRYHYSPSRLHFYLFYIMLSKDLSLRHKVSLFLDLFRGTR